MPTLFNINGKSRKICKEKRTQRKSFKSRIANTKTLNLTPLRPNSQGTGKRVKRKEVLAKHAVSDLVSKGQLIREVQMEGVPSNLSVTLMAKPDRKTRKALRLAAVRSVAEEDAMVVMEVDGPGTTLGAPTTS